jgi:hypothetical protein
MFSDDHVRKVYALQGIPTRFWHREQGHLPISDMRAIVSAIIVIVLLTAWMFRWSVTAPSDRAFAFVLDRWTGEFSFLTPSGRSLIPDHPAP